MMHIHIMDKKVVAAKLQRQGIKPTRQRILIGVCLFGVNQHVSADDVLLKVNQTQKLVSKATVYNTLGLFARHGLLKEVVIDPTKLVYDTNVKPHHHIYHMESGKLRDVDLNDVVTQVPDLDPSLLVDGVDVVIRVRAKKPI